MLLHNVVYTRRVQYPVYVVERPLLNDPSELSALFYGRKTLLVSTPTVWNLYGEKLLDEIAGFDHSVAPLVLNSSEYNKSTASLLTICKHATAHGLGRRDLLIGMGGGICLDLVRFAAAIIRRGIPYACIPTTLVGQVDAGIGIKGAANYGVHKNYLGCFHPPEVVYIDRSFLHTLPRTDILYGLAEIVKMALVSSPELFTCVETSFAELVATAFREPRRQAETIIALSARNILLELERNLYEDQTYRRSLDFGHTISPSLEQRSNYTLHHGAAVAIDMAFSTAVSLELGAITAPEANRIIHLIHAMGLPISSPLITHTFCGDACNEIRRHRGGKVNWVIPSGIARYEFLEDASEITEHVVTEAVAYLATIGNAQAFLPSTVATA